jgi:hypothetical protein
VNELDLSVRNATYRLFVDLGRAPRAGEVAAAMGLERADVDASWRRLHDEHALVLERDRSEIRMANPFSAVPTPHRVAAAGRRWYANCGWDAFGVCAALGVDGHISSSCPDCLEPIEIDVRGCLPEPAHHVFHVLVPARRWWDDVVFT